MICAVAVGGAAFYAYNGSDSGQTNEPKPVTVSNTDAPVAATGTREDWRSQFASATSSQLAGKTATKTPTTPDTITATLGIDMMAKFADLKQANLLGNSDIVNQTVNNMLSSDLNSTKPKTYSASDLHVTAATDSGSLTAFAIALANLINSYAATASEFAILQNYTANNDSSVLSGIDPAIKEQKRMLAGLLAIPVPQLLLQNDLDLINGMSTLEGASESIRVTDSDSVRGLVGSSMHVDGAEQITDALSAINKTLAVGGITFGLHWEILNLLLN